MVVCLWSNWIGDLLAIVGLVTCAFSSARHRLTLTDWIVTRKAGRSIDPASAFAIVAVGTGISWPIAHLSQNLRCAQRARTRSDFRAALCRRLGPRLRISSATCAPSRRLPRLATENAMTTTSRIAALLCARHRSATAARPFCMASISSLSPQVSRLVRESTLTS